MSPFILLLESEEETEKVARTMAPFLQKGDILALEGDLGTGKSTFARALIQLHHPGPVPSPTFTLVQTYDFGGTPLWHLDLYRLASPEDVFELGIEEAFATAITLIEWPQKMGAFLPSSAAHLTFKEGNHPSERRLHINLSCPSFWEDRWDQMPLSPWKISSLPEE